MNSSSAAINLDVEERVVIVGEDYCPFCQGAKNYFGQKNIPYKYIDCGEFPQAREELIK